MARQPGLTRFAGESWRTALAMHARVVGAVIMRDLQTRFGVGYLGFLFGLILPLGHLTIVMAVNTAVRKSAPLGTDTAIFAMAGALPFIMWLYGHRQVMITIAQNKSLTYFPGVDISDLLFAKAIIEVVAATLVVVTVLSALVIFGYNLNIYDVPLFAYALMLAWSLGILTGMLFGLMGCFSSVFLLIGGLMGPFFWISAGLFFLPDTLPDRVRDIIFFNPLAHIVDLVREAVYSEYTSLFYSGSYLAFSLISMLLVSMILMFIIRRVS